MEAINKTHYAHWLAVLSYAITTSGTKAAIVAQGEICEIWIHGPQVFQGCWNDPQKIAESFGELGDKRFLRSGDPRRLHTAGPVPIIPRA